jgi:sugar phosphate isomerase/epimerase
LRCTGAHQSYSAGEWQQIFDDANELGVQLTGSGMLANGTGAHPIPEGVEGRSAYDWMRAMTIDDAKRTAELANRIGDAAKKQALKYYYHNHPFEFVDFEGDVCAYDILLAETDPDLVDFQLDCGWAIVAGKDPIAILQAHPQRFSSLHIKNFLPLNDDMVSNYQRRSTELGNGVIDYAPILKTAKAIDIKHIYVEQESPFTTLQPMAAAKANVDYLEKLKQTI